MKEFAVFSGTANKGLAKKTAKELGVRLGKIKIEKFPDQETYIRLKEDVKGKTVFLIQPTCTPANQHLIELLLMADAAKRGKAKKVIAVIPYYGYARQDRIVEEGEAVSAELFAKLLRQAGVNEFIAMDLHSSAVESYLKPKKHLHALPIIAKYLKKKKLANLTVVAPDKGAEKKAIKQAKILNAKTAVIHKKRLSGSRVKAEKIEGNIKGKNCVIIDDIISTAGTMSEAVKILKKNGAKNVFTAATHGVFTGEAFTRLKSAPVKEVIVTNSIPQMEKKKKLKKLRALDTAPLIAKAVREVL